MLHGSWQLTEGIFKDRFEMTNEKCQMMNDKYSFSWQA
jgi:hypothetical protein